MHSEKGTQIFMIVMIVHDAIKKYPYQAIMKICIPGF